MKDVLQQIRDKLIHDNDLVGFVSTGPSSIEINPSYDYDHRRFNEAIDKVMGAAMSINEILDQRDTSRRETGPVGLRYNAHIAFKTAYKMLPELAQITDRRKSFIYVSSGYTSIRSATGRYARIQQRYQRMSKARRTRRRSRRRGWTAAGRSAAAYDVDTPLADQNYMQKTEFLESDLVGELAQLTREARRANVDVLHARSARA